MQNDKYFWKGHNVNMIAIEQDQKKLTYGELEKAIEEKVVLFKESGINENDHVILCINDQLMYIQIFLALWSMNVTIVPIDFQESSSNFKEIVKDSDANYIITSKVEKKRAIEADIGNFPNLKKIIFVTEDIETKIIESDGDKEINIHTEKKSKLNDAFMLFTSGTSGKRKGVVIKKHSFLRNVRKVIQYTQLSHADSLLINLPLSYSFALSQVCAHLLVGGRIIFSTNNVYNALILYEIKEKHVTNYPATPYFYENLAKEIEKGSELSVGNLKFFMSAGGYINPFVIETIVKKFPNIVFYNNYGQTEASPRISYNRFDAKSADFRGAGSPLPGVKVGIFDENGNMLEEGQIGEIGYQSEDLMLGYYKDKTLDREEFFMSGDLGCIENGNLIIVGRKDSLIKINGRKVYKNYIENAIFELPYVKNVKIKKERHDIYGEYFIAYIVPQKGENEKEIVEKIYDFCKLHFNVYERPKKIIICNEIKLSSNKKVKLVV